MSFDTILWLCLGLCLCQLQFGAVNLERSPNGFVNESVCDGSICQVTRPRSQGSDLLQRKAVSVSVSKVSKQPTRCQTTCVIPAGETWLLDTSLHVETLTIYGTLEWDRSKANLELRANYVSVEDGGQFILGTADSPMDLPATVYITKGPHSDPELGRRFLGGRGTGQIEIHGRKLQRTWTLLSKTVVAGETVLHLKHGPAEMGWQVGDRIGLATTSRGESSVHRIVQIVGKQLTVAEPVRDEHWGGYREIEQRRFELAAEVVNLERSVLITGDHEDIESSGEGLHTIQADGPGYMDMRYARVEFCGQRPVMGRYCLHFHLLKKCPRCVFQGNAVVDGEHVGITVHGTHDALVDQNVVWDAKANGLYIEDGNELRNTLSQNVMICSSLRKCRVSWVSGASSQTAGIFMIGMSNNIVENRIVGYENGIWTPGSFRGSGHGKAFGKVCPQFYPFGEWRGNTCHDCNRFGLYLDHQYPRNVKIDEDGLLLDKDSCEWFTKDGADNGVVNEVRDEVNWHNTYVGQYAIGDIQFINYTSVNNGHAMYWKVGKDFVDGRLWHLLDSVFANDPSDRYGVLQFLGPSGPFVFGMKNCAFLGRSPPGIAALAAGQHCGLRGGAGPCNVQYLLENIDFSKMHAQQPRLAFGANSNVGDAAVLPVFVTKDRSLGGFRSIVSSHLNGFAAAGCVPIDSTWAKDALGCEVSLRRLNIWGDDAGVLTLVGPGFNVVRDMTFPAEGRNGGDIKYDGVRNGYGSLVLSGQDYELTGLFNGPDRSWIVEFSDPVLDDYFGTDWVNLRVGGETCQLRQSDDRSFICAMGEFGGLCNSRTLSSHNIIAAGHVRCADGSPNPTPSPPSPSSTHTSSTVSQTTSTTSSSASTSRQAPVLFPPISGGSANWALHRELNCWDGHGARSLPNSNPLLGTYTVEGCREQCEMNLECEAAVIAKHVSTPKFPCFLRTILQISQCRDYADFDVWEIRRTTVTASTTSRSTVVTSATSTTTSITSSASSTSSSSSGDFVPVDGGIDRACRGASSGDNSPSYYVIQNGISGLEGCKAICIIDALCQGIEYSTGRCELWVRPGGIEATAAVSGFICLRYTGAPTTTPSPWSFFPVDGGVNRACRGRSVNDNLASYYHVAASRGMSLTQCQAACAELAGCQGIEHNQGGRCELWTKSIQATRSLTGYTCLRFDAWRLYQGSNCYEGHGGSLLHYITEKISVDGCKAECLKKDHCEGISVRSGWEESPCWLYTQINLNSCVLDYPDYDFWHRLQ